MLTSLEVKNPSASASAENKSKTYTSVQLKIVYVNHKAYFMSYMRSCVVPHAQI